MVSPVVSNWHEHERGFADGATDLCPLVDRSLQGHSRGKRITDEKTSVDELQSRWQLVGDWWSSNLICRTIHSPTNARRSNKHAPEKKQADAAVLVIRDKMIRIENRGKRMHVMEKASNERLQDMRWWQGECSLLP